MLILAGDVGGTNSRFCLVEVDGASTKKIREEIYPSIQEELISLVKRFLGNEDIPDVACFAVAGPVINNNHAWNGHRQANQRTPVCVSQIRSWRSAASNLGKYVDAPSSLTC